MIKIISDYIIKINNNYKHIKWQQWILISLSMLIAVILLFIPLVMIFAYALSEGFQVIQINLIDSDMLHAIYLTIIVALITVPINTIFGILIAWLLTRFNFFCKNLLFILLNMPIAISPVIIGVLYLLCYSSNGFIGKWLDLYNIQIMFTFFGIILVTICITCPFIANELIFIMMHQGNYEDEAAILLGASGWKMFRYVTFPNIRWALLYGAITTNARAIGEFGAVSIVSGLIRGETYTLPLYIELLYQDYNTVGAFIAAALLALISIIMLLLKNYLKYRLKKDS